MPAQTQHVDQAIRRSVIEANLRDIDELGRANAEALTAESAGNHFGAHVARVRFLTALRTLGDRNGP